MNRPLKVVDKFAAEQNPEDRKPVNVVPINAEHVPVLEGYSTNPLSAVPMADFKYRASHTDSKLADYLLIGLVSLLVHGVVVEQLKRMPLSDEELAKPIKLENKVQISFVQPKPKVVPPPPPPVVQKPTPPPPPKVVPLKKPPKPKVAPKPVPRPVQQPQVKPAAVKTFDAPVTSTPVIAPPPPPPPPKPKPVVEKVTQPSASAGYLDNPEPAYPEIAEERGWEGRVLMKVHVLANGKPDSVSVVKSSGHDVLDSEAVRTVKKWSFAPAKRGTTPVDGWVNVPLSFKLAN